MPRQKSAPKRSGIDLEKLLLNKDNETTNFTPLPRRGGEGGEVKKINHEAVAKLFLRAVKNKEEEEEEEKNATKTPTVITNFNDDVLDDDDDEKVEDRNTNNVLRLVKTLENSHEATRRALAEALGVVAGTQRERLETEEERRVILDENDDDDDDEKEEDKAGEVFGRSTHGEGVEEDIAALPSTTFGSATYAEQLKQKQEQVQRQQEKTEQHLLRIQKKCTNNRYSSSICSGCGNNSKRTGL